MKHNLTIDKFKLRCITILKAYIQTDFIVYKWFHTAVISYGLVVYKSN